MYLLCDNFSCKSKFADCPFWNLQIFSDYWDCSLLSWHKEQFDICCIIGVVMVGFKKEHIALLFTKNIYSHYEYLHLQNSLY